MHSLRYSRSKQLSSYCDVHVSTLIDKLRHETKKRAEFYTLKNGHESTENLLYEMELYATHKIFKTSFGDFVPYIMSNALGLNFLIVPAQPIPDAFEQGVHLVTPLSDLPHHDTPVIVVKWGEHYEGYTPVVKMAWSYVLSLNTNDEKLPNSNFKVSEKLPAGALSDREETIHISSLADKVYTNMAHSLCSWTLADDICVETKESSKGIDVTDCTVNQLHIDESQSDEPRDFFMNFNKIERTTLKI